MRRIAVSREVTLQIAQYEPVKCFASASAEWDGGPMPDGYALADLQAEVDAHLREQVRALRLAAASVTQMAMSNVMGKAWPPAQLVLPVPGDEPRFYKEIDRQEWEELVHEQHA